jgi:hypothetical protein
MIKWNEFNHYSRWGAIFLFLIALPILSFFIGRQYYQTRQVLDNNDNAPVENQIAEGCKVNPSNRVAADSYGADLRGGIECNFRISPNEPVYNFKLSADRERNAINRIEISRQDKPVRTILLENETDGPYMFDSPPMKEIFQAVDVNFDGYKDLQLITCFGATGNTCFNYFLFNPLARNFEYNKEFSDTNGIPDPAVKEIRVHVNAGCAGGCFIERTYKVLNNKPVLVKEVKQDYENSDPSSSFFVKTTTELIDGEMKVTSAERLVIPQE